jgi:hypothetical protein
MQSGTDATGTVDLMNDCHVFTDIADCGGGFCGDKAPVSVFNDATWHTVTIDISPKLNWRRDMGTYSDSGAAGAIVYMRLDAGTDAEYVAYGEVLTYVLPTPTYLGFTGRTGGAHNNHWVKNIQIGGPAVAGSQDVTPGTGNEPPPTPPPTVDVENAFFGIVTGGDDGEGLDMCGTFTYAVCIGLGVCGGQTVRDASFTNDDSTDGFAIVATYLLTTWGAASTFGDTDDDAALIELHAGIRWSGKGETFTVDMDVVPDTPYRLQMLFQEKCCQRGWDVEVEGILIAENISPVDIVGSQDMSAAAQLTLDYVSTDDKLSVVFGGVSEAHGDSESVFDPEICSFT